jgi:quinol monooxygenase YgiN
MSKFGLYGKIIAQPGQRDALVAGLLEAAALMQRVPGCELYVVNVSASEPDVVWVTEVWRSASDHQASLALEEIKALIKRTMPLIAGGERIEIIPIAGKGLATE